MPATDLDRLKQLATDLILARAGVHPFLSLTDVNRNIEILSPKNQSRVEELVRKADITVRHPSLEVGVRSGAHKAENLYGDQNLRLGAMVTPALTAAAVQLFGQLDPAQRREVYLASADDLEHEAARFRAVAAAMDAAGEATDAQ